MHTIHALAEVTSEAYHLWLQLWTFEIGLPTGWPQPIRQPKAVLGNAWKVFAGNYLKLFHKHNLRSQNLPWLQIKAKSITETKKVVIYELAFGQPVTSSPPYKYVNHQGLFNQHGYTLTHWGRDKMDAISQTTLSNAFLWMKILEFWSRFHWCLFRRIQLTIFQHWFR